MKNYYKILGVKENASEEEIRSHWIGLTKHYHPDRGETHRDDEKIKAINEAYQVLKFSSTRMAYDLKRKYYRKKKKASLRRIILPVSLFAFFLIIGIILLIRFKSSFFAPPGAPSTPPSQKTAPLGRNQSHRIDPAEQRSKVNGRDQTFFIPSSVSEP